MDSKRFGPEFSCRMDSVRIGDQVAIIDDDRYVHWLTVRHTTKDGDYVRISIGPSDTQAYHAGRASHTIRTRQPVAQSLSADEKIGAIRKILGI